MSSTTNQSEIDVVYFVKNGDVNEELTYSLRSVEKNFPFRKLWLVGGCPKNIKEDFHIRSGQSAPMKYDRVGGMLRSIVRNNDLSENFYLFNDDFFVMKPIDEMPVLYRCNLCEHIVIVEESFGGKPTEYTKRLRNTFKLLHKEGLSDARSYELHVPFLINREKFNEMAHMFPYGYASRSLYGNLYKVGGTKSDDVKIYDNSSTPFKKEESPFISTSDHSWRENCRGVADYIKSQFPDKSRFEK